MGRTDMLILAGAAAVGLLAACADEAPTANPQTSKPSSTLIAGAAVSSPVRSVGQSTDIYACVNNSSGEMKIVPSGTTCAHNEYLISWNTGGGGGGGGSGITGYEIVAHQEFLPPGFWGVHVECTAGKKVLGGGFNIETPNDVKLYSSDPSDGSGNLIDHGWNVFVTNAGSVVRQTSVYAICAFAQ